MPKDRSLSPRVDGGQDLGTATHRWHEIYGQTVIANVLHALDLGDITNLQAFGGSLINMTSITGLYGTFSAHIRSESALGGYSRQFAIKENVNVTAVHTITLEVEVPAATRVLGAIVRVNGESPADDLSHNWRALYTAEAADQIIVVDRPVTAGVKYMSMFNPNTASPITTGVANIIIQRESDPGSHVFDAQGSFSAVVFYERMI